MTLATLGIYMQVKVLGQRSSKMLKIVFGHHHLFAIYFDSGSGSKVGFKVKGQGQVQRSNVWHAVVDTRELTCREQQGANTPKSAVDWRSIDGRPAFNLCWNKAYFHR